MKKIAIGLTTILAIFSLAVVAYAGSTHLSFNGGNGSVVIASSAPGISSDQFQVEGGEFSLIQEISSGSTHINRYGEFSGGGSILVMTTTSDPEVAFSAYLGAERGSLLESISHGSSVEFGLAIEGESSGTLEVFVDTGQRLDCGFNLTYDASMMNFSANTMPFTLNWITFFDNNVTIDGGGGTY